MVKMDIKLKKEMKNKTSNCTLPTSHTSMEQKKNVKRQDGGSVQQCGVQKNQHKCVSSCASSAGVFCHALFETGILAHTRLLKKVWEMSGRQNTEGRWSSFTPTGIM
uniref:Uncharacterized protein n=1 Tax=Anguilla anguilla TaxID=7936 RepID=A0A0E9WH69_ANGAN